MEKLQLTNDFGKKRPTPIKAIRAKCLECSNDQPGEVRECVIPGCPIYTFRMGKNPNRKGIGNLKGAYASNLRS